MRNFFIGNKKDKKKETMSNEGEYEALEKSVRYIPWKGKKEEWYTWHKTFLVRAMIRGYHGVLVELEEVPTDDKAKVLASTASTNLTSDQKITDNDNDEKVTKEEKALKTSFKKQFKGKCRVCGKIGHKGADCWTLESNKDKRPTNNHGEKKYNFTGTCNYCHKKGHKEAECRTKINDNANNVEEEHALMTSYCAKKENTDW